MWRHENNLLAFEQLFECGFFKSDFLVIIHSLLEVIISNYLNHALQLAGVRSSFLMVNDWKNLPYMKFKSHLNVVNGGKRLQTFHPVAIG